ncbi:hypothetical protein JW848_09255 [Candidatus Bipolaricaulota bacterium]|nr:hypothetical protein [Candidatus Bipolaricaulota bacterium]
MERFPISRIRSCCAVALVFLISCPAIAPAYDLTVGVSASPAVERNNGKIEWHAGYLLATSWTATSGTEIGLGLRGDFALSAVSLGGVLRLPVSTAVEISAGIDIGWIDLQESVSFLTATHLDLTLQSGRLDPFQFRVDLTLLLAELVARNEQGLIGIYVGFPRSGSVSLTGQATPSWAFTEKVGISFLSLDTTQFVDPIGAISDTLLFMPEFTTLLLHTSSP